MHYFQNISKNRAISDSSFLSGTVFSLYLEFFYNSFYNGSAGIFNNQISAQCNYHSCIFVRLKLSAARCRIYLLLVINMTLGVIMVEMMITLITIVTIMIMIW